jgi:hypothetical protein
MAPIISLKGPLLMPKMERGGHTYTPDNGGADRLVAEEIKQSKAVGMLERELGA